MPKSDVHELCLAVEDALQGVDDAIASPAATSETLNSFWALQDNLYRLVDCASDEFDEASHVLRTRHPMLLRTAHELLEAAEARKLTQNAAVASACANAQLHLHRLEHLSQARVSAARA